MVRGKGRQLYLNNNNLLNGFVELMLCPQISIISKFIFQDWLYLADTANSVLGINISD